MEKLPVEILREIFKFLHPEDKVDCILVCRSWEQIIRNTVLFNTIRFRNKMQIHNLVGNICSETQNGNRVERLIMQVENVEVSDIIMLPSLFPNIIEVAFYQYIYNGNPQFKEMRFFNAWKNTIKVITDLSCQFLTTQILRRGVCPLLAEIQIHSKFKRSADKLIELLINAPNLKILKLHPFQFTLRCLEILHNNVPLLESLSLTYSQINSDIIPTGIKPAQYMKKLELIHVSTTTTENFINVENYFATKYPYISHLAFNVDIGRDSNLEACMNRGFALQIQQIRSHLTSLEFVNNNNSVRYIFPILDRNGCKIKRITVEKTLEEFEFQQIVQSNQVQYIQTFSCTPRSWSTITKNFDKLSALTELKLCFISCSTTVDFSNLLSKIGNSLQTLVLKFAKISLDMSLIPLCSKLKKLELIWNELPPGTDVFISQAFPNLQNLAIDGCVWSSPEFCMKNSSLSHLEIGMKLPFENSYILIITTSNNEKRWYSANKVYSRAQNRTNDLDIYPAVKSLPFDKYNGVPYKTFVCKSLRTLFLMNTDIELKYF